MRAVDTLSSHTWSKFSATVLLYLCFVDLFIEITKVGCENMLLIVTMKPDTLCDVCYGNKVISNSFIG